MKSTIILSSGYSEVVKIGNIVFIAGSGSYSEVFLNDKRKIVCTIRMHTFEENLRNEFFFRIHKSYLINLNYVFRVFHTDLRIELMDNTRLPLSRDKKKDFWEMLIHLTGGQST